MFETDYKWKVEYVVYVRFFHDVDQLRIWWDYCDCMFEFAFGRSGGMFVGKN